MSGSKQAGRSHAWLNGSPRMSHAWLNGSPRRSHAWLNGGRAHAQLWHLTQSTPCRAPHAEHLMQSTSCKALIAAKVIQTKATNAVLSLEALEPGVSTLVVTCFLHQLCIPHVDVLCLDGCWLDGQVKHYPLPLLNSPQASHTVLSCIQGLLWGAV